jgi:hypothetical protein
MIEVYFPPSVPHIEFWNYGIIEWRHKHHAEYLGIAQQLFAQTMGWA